MRFRCPHCGTRSVIRTSEQITPTFTRFYVQCPDVECGHAWRVDAASNVTISPSAKPNPGVQMEISQHVRRDLIVLQMETARIGHHQIRGPYQPDLDGLQDGDRAPLPERSPALTRP